MKSMIIPALAALALSAPAAAFATPDARSVAVRTSDLNLDNPLEASVLAGRIDAAAAQVCGADRGSVTDVQRAVRRSACYGQAVTQALAQLEPSVADAVARARVTRIPPP